MNTAVERWFRWATRCAVLVLVACLLGDMATPVLPGAFRLDPSESIEVTANRTVSTAAPAPDPPLVGSDRGVMAPPALRARRARPSGVPRRSVPAPALRAFATSESPGASDDD